MRLVLLVGCFLLTMEEVGLGGMVNLLMRTMLVMMAVMVMTVITVMIAITSRLLGDLNKM